MRILFLCLIVVMTSPVLSQKAKPLEVKQVAQGVYLHTSYKHIEGYGLMDSNGLVVLDGTQAYIIDTPWSDADTTALLQWITQNGYHAKASISTHFHEDRSAGIGLLNTKSIPTYTSERTKLLLYNAGKPTPTHTFTGSFFSLAGGLIELYYPGAGHTKDNIVAWLPNSNILVGGCLVRTRRWQSLGYTADADIGAWAHSIRNIKKQNYDIRLVVPGHGSLSQPDILDHTIRLAEVAAKKLAL
ncbi:subclass B1 metallo-beta-lactamase [Psychrobium sp. 1_MG-2023]|uniref:subclass B1 metallo-beta-lactamase n=1 Tax=Psychrobium sp. 1_MG-2023 TaxID=3062624 RepID=UPI000C34530D|nr:subclass B1 metallo-beta-lactamase [Psychrobium sp. 1_MG-2023]MDP2560011.1 subclass B1 metallo-beta-lactamase [Psychrobium sp. 1_MG-2023]PKF56327.1 subclass B1 metallo-beta-lactamase [Alteromonadales bacterium alter-6D02]